MSHLFFQYNILGEVVLRQFLDHLLANNPFYCQQSAYRAGYSTKLVIVPKQHFLKSLMTFSLLWMKTKPLSHLCLVCLLPIILLTILLSRHSDSFTVSDTVLAWFTYYLYDCTQTISGNGSKSLPVAFQYNILKGSVLGPILFVVCVQPL